MAAKLSPVVEVDQTKKHHYVIYGCPHTFAGVVKCLDCNDEMAFSWSDLDGLLERLVSFDDTQVLLVVVDDVKY